MLSKKRVMALATWLSVHDLDTFNKLFSVSYALNNDGKWCSWEDKRQVRHVAEVLREERRIAIPPDMFDDVMAIKEKVENNNMLSETLDVLNLQSLLREGE